MDIFYIVTISVMVGTIVFLTIANHRIKKYVEQQEEILKDYERRGRDSIARIASLTCERHKLKEENEKLKEIDALKDDVIRKQERRIREYEAYEKELEKAKPKERELELRFARIEAKIQAWIDE